MKYYPAFGYYCYFWYQHYSFLKWEHLMWKILHLWFPVGKKSLVLKVHPECNLFYYFWHRNTKTQVDWCVFRNLRTIAKFIGNPANKSTSSKWPRLKIFSRERKGRHCAKTSLGKDIFISWRKKQLYANFLCSKYLMSLLFHLSPTNWEGAHNFSSLNDLAAYHYRTGLFGYSCTNKLNLVQTRFKHWHLINAVTWLAHSHMWFSPKAKWFSPIQQSDWGQGSTWARDYPQYGWFWFWWERGFKWMQVIELWNGLDWKRP